MAQHGYTSAEKARIREGWQCPSCFGPWIETTSRGHFEPWHFQCLDCGTRWGAADSQFQSSTSNA